MKIKVQDLPPGPQMDALVAEVANLRTCDGMCFNCEYDEGCETGYHPSTNGGQAMELVKKFGVYVIPDGAAWAASTEIRDTDYPGRTPEIAICRAVIASEKGEYVEIEESN